MVTELRRLWRQQSGEDTAEYALLAALLVLVLVVVLVNLGKVTGLTYRLSVTPLLAPRVVVALAAVRVEAEELRARAKTEVAEAEAPVAVAVRRAAAVAALETHLAALRILWPP